MAEENKRTNRKKVKKKRKKISFLRLFIVLFLLTAFVGGGIVGGYIFATIKNAPEIDPTQAINLLNLSSEILDKDGKLIEKIQTQEFRTIVDLDEISDYVKDAFIAIEDERFIDHFGIDPKGIVRAFMVNLKAGANVEGASTITQQLAKNLYLTNDKTYSRKIKEAYIAIQMEKELSKDQILKAYLNTINLGQGAYGVQEAAETYFSKDAKDLTIAESAMIAGITKSPSKYPPYKRFDPDNVDEEKDVVVGYVDVLGKRYAAVLNPDSIARQRIILKKMFDLGIITEQEYNEAINTDMSEVVKPGTKRNKEINTSFFNDYVKTKVIEDLITKKGWTEDEAIHAISKGGLKIYSTMDINLQSRIEDVYDNFMKILAGDTTNVKGAALVIRKLNNGNIIDSRGKIMYYQKSNILDNENNLILDKNDYKINNNGDLVIKSNKVYYRNLDITGYYDIDNTKTLITYGGSYIPMSKENYIVDKDNRQVIIKNKFIEKNDDFYTIDNNQNLKINRKYLYLDSHGVVQPQSAIVILDYNTGEIKGLIGGRNIKNRMVLNRATDSPRQPGSAIKPIAVYLPALDNGFTAASVIDDIPHYDRNGKLWPRNWYRSYRGLSTLRNAVEQSINVISVKVLEQIGVNTSVNYLTSLGIIDAEHPENDSFVSKSESSNSDEDLAPLALGGMNYGITPLRMTAAFGAVANKGIYSEPIAYTKVLDKNGEVLLENKSEHHTVVSPQVAYLMTDILKSTVTSGLANRAKIYPGNGKVPVTGKTGTTQDKSDAWFAGYTPYYSAALWIGNDNPAIKLSQGSRMAATLWSEVMKAAHEGLPDKNFIKPQGLVTRKICIDSGKLATELCSKDPRGNRVRNEMFIKGTEPTEQCETHVQVAIDTSTKKLVNDYCPAEFREFKVFIKRNPPYNPEDHNNIVPSDYQYEAPTETCDVHKKTEEPNNDDWFNNWIIDNDEEDDDDEQYDENNIEDNTIEYRPDPEDIEDGYNW